MGGTKINELFDGNKYVDALQKTQRYSFTKKGNLQLFYSDTEYLLFIKPSQRFYYED
ncbi:hypothetical protein [Ornithobacterium rhinotracheale]|uniref:hypothetical protein n=1 Tax=Ornithobacterium rhinotracheale TaxID=28251 RepID=UPI004037228E